MSQDNDPWGNNPRNTEGNDFGAIIDNLKKRFFGEQPNPSSNGSTPSGGGGMPSFSAKALLPVVAVAALGWGATGIYILPEGYNGVELTFGRYTETAKQPGFNMHKPYPIGSVTKVNVGELQNLTVANSGSKSEGQMLTSDENIVEVSLSVQYRIGEAEKYLFNVNAPEQVLRETLISSIREVVGASTVDEVLIEKRAEWPAEVRKNLIDTLAGFDVGFDILRVELREAKAPGAVQEAFDDAVKAREDAERYKLQAEAYYNKKIPLAKGDAQRIVENAEAYKASVVAKATGEASRFNEILKSYRLAPKVTRDRLYIETLQSVYEKVNNVVVATGDNAPMMYLPVNGQTTAPMPLPKPAVEAQSKQQTQEAYQREYELPVPTTLPNKRLTR